MHGSPRCPRASRQLGRLRHWSVGQMEPSTPLRTGSRKSAYTVPSPSFASDPCYDSPFGEGHPSRSRSRTQKPWCAHSSSSTTCTHSSTDLPLAYGGQPWPAGTGAGADSSSGVTVDSQRPSSAPCTSRTASTSSRLGVAARSRPCSSWSGTKSDASPIAVNGPADPRQQRRNHESCTNTRWRRVSTADHSPPTRWCSEPLGIPWSRPSVAAQSARSCREASCRSAGSAERMSSRTGWRRSSSASTYDVTSTPLTTRLLTSPSMTASCITTPIRRARVKSHSRNSASVRSSSSNLAMPGSIRLRTDTPRHDCGVGSAADMAGQHSASSPAGLGEITPALRRCWLRTRALAADREPVKRIERGDCREAEQRYEDAQHGSRREPAKGKQKTPTNIRDTSGVQRLNEEPMTGGVLPDCVERQGGGVECDAVEDDRGAQAVPSPQCSGKDGGGEREKRHHHQQEGVEQEYDSVGKPDLIKHNVVVCPYLPDEQKAQGVGQVGRPQCAQARSRCV